VRRIVGAAVVCMLVAAPLAAAPRFIGPWFTDSSLNRATNTVSLTAGQNTPDLGITVTCFDRHVSLGIWKPHGSLDLDLGRQATVTFRVDQFDPVLLVGIGTQRNLAEFSQNVDILMREIFAGRQVHMIFDGKPGSTIEETFPLDNTPYAFADIAQNCPLQ